VAEDFTQGGGRGVPSQVPAAIRRKGKIATETRWRVFPQVSTALIDPDSQPLHWFDYNSQYTAVTGIAGFSALEFGLFAPNAVRVFTS